MNRSQLEHVLRAAGAITLQQDFVVIGSQAILGSCPDAPAELLVSVEVDLYPREKPEDSILVDGAIGEGSMFHDTFGYYAHGVGPETATVPKGWKTRLVAVRNENTGGVTGWCLEPHDLAVSKLAAGRDNDYRFVGVLLRHGIVEESMIRDRIMNTPVDDEMRELFLSRMNRVVQRE